MIWRTEKQEVGKTHKAVVRWIVVLLGGFLLWSGFTKSYRYYSSNGSVWLSEQPLLAKWLGFSPKVFHDFSRGEIQIGKRYPVAGGLEWVPALYTGIPLGADPYQWKPPMEHAKAALKRKYYSYESITFISAQYGADTNLLAGETRTVAHERLLEFMAHTCYRSFGESAGR